MALGIIGVSHVISISTGLSISSIATDKKVGAGGPYYIVSRSLGLPIGGTLGLALFTGLAFSVSLYVIGFSESFLSYLNIERTTAAIRICGSITLAVITAITLISTEFAIKTQYLILALDLGLARERGARVARARGEPTAHERACRRAQCGGSLRGFLPGRHRVHGRREHVGRSPESEVQHPQQARCSPSPWG